MSLDGFVAGPNDGLENSLGDGGNRLFEWYFSGNTEVPISDGQMTLKVSSQSAEILREVIAMTGAGVWGRKTFDIARAWGGHPPSSPCFIVTHNVPDEWNKKDSPFTFVTDGIESAISQAKIAAGEKNVGVCTATILHQCINAGLIDEIQIDLVPVLLGGGVRLFDNLNSACINLKCIKNIQTSDVTHLHFRVIK